MVILESAVRDNSSILATLFIFVKLDVSDFIHLGYRSTS